jgi:hypothetical protein
MRRDHRDALPPAPSFCRARAAPASPPLPTIPRPVAAAVERAGRGSSPPTPFPRPSRVVRRLRAVDRGRPSRRMAARGAIPMPPAARLSFRSPRRDRGRARGGRSRRQERRDTPRGGYHSVVRRHHARRPGPAGRAEARISRRGRHRPCSNAISLSRQSRLARQEQALIVRRRLERRSANLTDVALADRGRRRLPTSAQPASPARRHAPRRRSSRRSCSIRAGASRT